MKIKVLSFIFLLIAFNCNYLLGNEHTQIDSLLKQIALNNNTVKCYIKLSNIYIESNKQIEALNCLELAKKIATPKEIPLVYNRIGNYYLQLNEISEAEKNYKISYQYLQKNYDEELTLKVLTNLAEVNIVNYKNKEALGLLFMVDSIINECKNKEKYDNVIIDNNFRKGCIYKKFGLYEKSMEINFKNIKILEPINGNCSAEYLEIGNIKNRLKDVKSAINYYQKSAFIADKVKDNYNAHTALNNIALIYIDLKQFDSADYYLIKATNYYRPNDSLRLFETALSKAKISYIKQDFSLALLKYNDALKLWDKKNNLEFIRYYYYDKANVYLALKKYSHAKLEILNMLEAGKGLDDLEIMRNNYLKLAEIEYYLKKMRL